MIISKKKLSDFLPSIFKFNDDQIFDTLLNIGIEVSKIITYKNVEYLKIGQIIQVKHHPHNKELCVCNVEIDYERIITVVTTGKNAKKALNKYVVVATKGCLLPNNFLVKSVDIDGIVSDGIFCNYSQLNPLIDSELNEEYRDKIIILEKAEVGDSNINKYIGMDDTFFEITLPSNRSDLCGIRYIAKELGSVLKIKYHENVKIGNRIKSKRISSTKKKGKNASNLFKMRSNTNRFRYFGGVSFGIENSVNVKSDWSIKGLLLNSHVMPSSFFYDILNLISFDTGVPINVYDADKLNGNLVLEEATSESDFVSENSVYKIKPGDLVVTDGSKIISIVGVANHRDVCINENTKNFLFEIGSYDCGRVNRTINRLRSENFSNLDHIKSVSLIQCHDTIREILSMLEKIPLNVLHWNILNPIKKNLYSRKTIKFDCDEIRNFLGVPISNVAIKNIFKSLNLSVRGSVVKVPSYRIDLQRWEDLVEEIIKIIGIDNIASKPIFAKFNLTNEVYFKDISLLYFELVSLQFTNVKTMNLCSREEVDRFNLFNIVENIELNTDYSNRRFLRKSLTNELLKVISYNKRYKNSLYPVFEIQKINFSHINDELHVGLVIPTNIFKTSWRKSDNLKNDIFFAKGLTEKIVNLFGFSVNFRINENEWFVDGESLNVEVYGQLIGYLGKIKKSCLVDYGLADLDVYAIEINLERLINSYNQYEIKSRPFNKLQESFADITLLTKNRYDFAIIKNIFNQIKEIKSWKTISVYNEKVYDKEENATGDIENSNLVDSSFPVSYTIRYSLFDAALFESVLETITKKMSDHGIFIKK